MVQLGWLCRRSVVALVFFLAGLPAARPVLGVDGPNEIVSHIPPPGATFGGNGNSHAPVIGWDGEYVAFFSNATNLVDGSQDTNGRPDVFLWSRKTDTITPVTAFKSGTSYQFLDRGGETPSMTSDGKYVAFTSDSQQLPGAVPAHKNCYLWERDTGAFELLSAVDEGSSGGDASCSPGGDRVSLSQDGRFAVFTSQSTNLDPDTPGFDPTVWRIYLRDRDNDRTYDLTIPPSGPLNPNGGSWDPVISADGHWIAYRSSASNIRMADADGLGDIFVWRNEDSGPRPAFRVDSDNMFGGNIIDTMELSADGGVLVFETEAALSAADTDQTRDVYAYRDGLVTLVSQDAGSVSTRPTIDYRGRKVAFHDLAEINHVQLVDLDTLATRRFVWRTDGSPPGKPVGRAMISDNGQLVTFQSEDPGLVFGDNNGEIEDVFVVTDVFDIVDPNPALRGADGSLLADDPERWGETRAHRGVNGIAADGVTPVLLRFDAQGVLGDEVTFEVFDEDGSGSPPRAGYLSSRPQIDAGNPERMSSINVPIETLNDQRRVAFAIYEPPEDFVRSDPGASCPDPAKDACRRSRRIDIKLLFASGPGGPVSPIERSLELERPPLVLLHGLWSDDERWKFDLLDDSRFDITAYSYKSTNASSFATNFGVPRGAWMTATQARRDRYSAVTRVDLLGHSMGGVLTRIFQASGQYLHAETWGTGYFHRVVTTNSPHRGSPIPDCLIRLRESVVGLALLDLLDLAKKPSRLGAIDDLRVLSPAILAMGDTDVPSHAFTGLGGRDFLDGAFAVIDLLGWDEELHYLLEFIDATQDGLFWNVEHDLAVSEPSQQGGLSLSNLTSFSLDPFSLDFAIHSTMPDDRGGNRLVDLLNRPRADGVWAPGFLQPDPNPRPEEMLNPQLCRTLPFSVISASTLYLEGPGSVTPGETVTITAQALGGGPKTEGLQVDEVLFFVDGAGQPDDAPPFALELTVPEEAVGEIQIDVAGISSQGKLVLSSEPLTLPVVIGAQLEDLWIEPSPLVVDGLTPRAEYRVHGRFSDGITRDLTPLSVGTQAWISQSVPRIASIPASGIIQAENKGQGQLFVKNEGKTAAAEVQVLGGRLRLGLPSPGTAGLPNTLVVSGATPGVEVTLLIGDELGSYFNPLCAGEWQLNTVAGSELAKPNGVAEIGFTPDASFAGGQVFFQAFERISAMSFCSASDVLETTLD